ncbi:MAG: hypothetical protein JKY37_29875 [Nannocystaceae bacterium]|nr:hypothetical protein [Nannocystaceae bacterium]
MKSERHNRAHLVFAAAATLVSQVPGCDSAQSDAQAVATTTTEPGVAPAASVPETRVFKLEGGGRLTVPDDWAEAPVSERRHFARSSTALQPSADLEFQMAVPPTGFQSGLLLGQYQRFDEPAHVYGWTPEELANWSVSAVNAAGEIPAQGGATRRGAGMEVLLRYRSGKQVRKRWWGRNGGLVEAACLCRGAGCSAFRGCVLPPVPTDAMASTAPLVGSKPAKRVQLPGVGTVEISPDWVEAEETQMDRLRAFDNGPPLKDELAFVPASSHVLGMVALSHKTRAIEGGCDAESFAEGRRRLSNGTLSARRVDGQGQVELVAGDLERWARRIFWCEGSTLHSVSCDCAGTPCALARRTCVLRGDEPSTTGSGSG